MRFRRIGHSQVIFRICYRSQGTAYASVILHDWLRAVYSTCPNCHVALLGDYNYPVINRCSLIGSMVHKDCFTDLCCRDFHLEQHVSLVDQNQVVRATMAVCALQYEC